MFPRNIKTAYPQFHQWLIVYLPSYLLKGIAFKPKIDNEIENHYLINLKYILYFY